MRRDHRGQSLVEFALILPIFILLLVGLFDIGRAVYAYNTVNNAARQGARLAVVDQTVTHIQDRAISQGSGLALDSDDVDVEFVKYADPDTDCVAADLAGGIRSCMAVVTVTYQYAAATPIIAQIIGAIDLIGESQFRLEFHCEGATCPLGE